MTQPKQPEVTKSTPEGRPTQPKQPEVTKPEPEEKPKQSETTKSIPQPIIEEKAIEYKTIYKGDSALEYEKQLVENPGVKGKEITTISFTRDESTGKIVENISTKIEKQPVDRVVKVGNVKEEIIVVKRDEQFISDETLEKGTRIVKDEGQDEEKTTISIYKVNATTGELSDLEVSTKTAKNMRPKITVVGTKEDKPHLLPVNSGLENAVNVTEATAEMKNVDLLTNEKLKAQLTPSDIEINRDLFLKRKELQKKEIDQN